MNKLSTMIKDRFEKAREDSNGFSLLELVVAVGIILILTVGGLLAYSKITENSRIAALNAAASDVFTVAYAYENDNDDATTPEKAAEEFTTSKGAGSTVTVTAKSTDDGGLTVTATDSKIKGPKGTVTRTAAKWS